MATHIRGLKLFARNAELANRLDGIFQLTYSRFNYYAFSSSVFHTEVHFLQTTAPSHLLATTFF